MEAVLLFDSKLSLKSKPEMQSVLVEDAEIVGFVLKFSEDRFVRYYLGALERPEATVVGLLDRAEVVRYPQLLRQTILEWIFGFRVDSDYGVNHSISAFLSIETWQVLQSSPEVFECEAELSAISDKLRSRMALAGYVPVKIVDGSWEDYSEEYVFVLVGVASEVAYVEESFGRQYVRLAEDWSQWFIDGRAKRAPAACRFPDQEIAVFVELGKVAEGAIDG